MNLFTKFIEALRSSRQREADRVIRDYRHIIDEARAYDQKKKIEVAGKSAWGAPPHHLFMGEKPLFNS